MAESPVSQRDARLSPGRRWWFRGIACGVPTCLGLAAVLSLLIHQGRIVTDADSGLPHLADPPIYLEEPGHEITGHRYLYDPLLGWRNIPGWEATTRQHHLKINSRGLRDREHPFAKPSGVRRILLLGDSYAWGYGVSNEETFADLLEQRLMRRQPRWEVLNGGVSGWGTDQEFLFLEHEGLRYDPDLVVVAFYLINDPFNNSESKQYGLHKPFFEDESLTLANSPAPRPDSGAPALSSHADPIILTAAIFGAMQRLCRAHGCPLVIVKFGGFLAEGEQEAAFYREISQALAEHLPADVYYLDWDEAFAQRSVPVDDILTGNDDGHWNALGHQLTAEILQEYLVEQELLGTDG